MSSLLDRARALELQAAAAQVTPSSQGPKDFDDGLLAVAGPIMAFAYAIALGAAATTFWRSTEALFAVVISAGFAAIYFAIPMLMLRLRRDHDARFDAAHPDGLSDTVATFTGPMQRWEAILQMVIIPVAVMILFCSFATILAVLRP